MKTKLLEITFTTALIVCIGGGLLFGTIKIIDAMQTDCPERTRPKCIKKIQKQPCPGPKPFCALNAVAQSERPYNKEYSQ